MAEAGAQGEIIAHAMYVEIGPRKAPDGVREGLAAFLPAAGSTSNPAHMLAAAGSPGVIVISHW